MVRAKRLMLLALLCAPAVSQVTLAQARWINDARSAAADAQRAPISLQFRRELTLSVKPTTFRVQVSADNRFVLTVNQHPLLQPAAKR